MLIALSRDEWAEVLAWLRKQREPQRVLKVQQHLDDDPSDSPFIELTENGVKWLHAGMEQVQPAIAEKLKGWQQHWASDPIARAMLME